MRLRAGGAELQSCGAAEGWGRHLNPNPNPNRNLNLNRRGDQCLPPSACWKAESEDLPGGILARRACGM